MMFDYRRSAPLHELPVLSTTELCGHLHQALVDGWRLLGLFGLQEASGVGLCCVLCHDPSRRLQAVRTPCLENFSSMTPSCPQVHYFEREIHEQWGLEPQGHPWLKSVRRIPDAPVTPHGDTANAPTPYPFYRVEGGHVHEVAVGPVHAGVIEPGHFRFQCYGENVLHLEIALGYQHRGMEHMFVHGPGERRLPLAECIAGDTSVGHALAHCVLLERLTETKIPHRAQLVRRIGLELERLANHVGDLGAIAGDTGFLPTASWNGRIRGDFLNMTATLCGNRFGRGLVRPGGVGHDLSPTQCADLLARARSAGRDALGSAEVLLHSPSACERLTGVGVLSKEYALQLGVVGVAARACGLPLDARQHAPLSDLSCEGCMPRTESSGDVMARTLVRRHEMEDSLRLLEADLSALAGLPAEPAATEDIRALPPDTLAVAQVEGWRGEICHMAVTGPDGRLAAYKIVDPSFRNWPGLAVALRNNQISDFPLCNKSFNLSYCGHDL